MQIISFAISQFNKLPLPALTHWGRDKMAADDIFECISLNENVWIPIEISLNFVPQGPINYTPTLV